MPFRLSPHSSCELQSTEAVVVTADFIDTTLVSVTCSTDIDIICALIIIDTSSINSASIDDNIAYVANTVVTTCSIDTFTIAELVAHSSTYAFSSSLNSNPA